jgi:hypothetical protein
MKLPANDVDDRQVTRLAVPRQLLCVSGMARGTLRVAPALRESLRVLRESLRATPTVGIQASGSQVSCKLAAGR